MGWRAGQSEGGEEGAHEGVWVAGVDGPVAVFDLSRSPAWLLGPRVRRLWFEDDLAERVVAEVLDDAPPLRGALAPREESGSFVFAVPEDPPRPLHGDAVWTLGMLDLSTFRYLELPASSISPAGIAFAGAEAAPGARIAWSLELRVGSTAVARAGGRK